MNTINKNFPWCDEYTEKSFLGILDNERHWSDVDYFELESDLIALAEEHMESDTLPRDQAWRVMRIFSHTMLLLGCHFDSGDGFKIQNLDCEAIRHRRDQFQSMVEGFFQGKIPKSEIFEYSHPNKQQDE